MLWSHEEDLSNKGLKEISSQTILEEAGNNDIRENTGFLSSRVATITKIVENDPDYEQNSKVTRWIIPMLSR